MWFRATEYNFSIFLLMAVTIFMAALRLRKTSDNNWPVLYWMALTVITARYQEETFDARFVLCGLGAALFLRFEFLAGSLVSVLRFVELCAYAFVIYSCYSILFYY